MGVWKKYLPHSTPVDMKAAKIPNTAIGIIFVEKVN